MIKKSFNSERLIYRIAFYNIIIYLLFIINIFSSDCRVLENGEWEPSTLQQVIFFLNISF